MTKRKFKVVHYLNQYGAGIGEEEAANTEPGFKEGTARPGEELQKELGDSVEIVATIFCGDNYFAENIEEARQALLNLVEQQNPDLLIAGPALGSGRYGLACAELCRACQEKLKIPTITAMSVENPGVDECRKSVLIIKTGKSALGMKSAISAMARLALKILNGKELRSPKEEGCIPKGIRKNYFALKTGAERAIDMLVRILENKEVQTEYQMPVFDKVTPLPPIEDLSEIKIALITSGGIVPQGNPDRIESSSASKFGKYPLDGLTALSSQTHQTAHGGYDPTYANDDPNRVLPLDVLRELEEKGVFGKLYDFYYATVGNGTSVAKAKEFAKGIAKELIKDGVGAVILTST